MKNQSIALQTAAIISNILFECNSDAELTEICLDDYGQCIHAKLEGCLYVDEIVKIGQEFDSSTGIYPVDEDAVEIVFSNYKHETITIPSITIKIKQITGE